jgi:hypothetical protein
MLGMVVQRIPSLATFDFQMALVDAVDQALEERRDPMGLVDDQELLAEWMVIPPAVTWRHVVERVYHHRYVSVPRHWPGEHVELARALCADACSAACLVEWAPAVDRPSLEMQLRVLVLLTTVVRLRGGRPVGPAW